MILKRSVVKNSNLTNSKTLDKENILGVLQSLPFKSDSILPRTMIKTSIKKKCRKSIFRTNTLKRNMNYGKKRKSIKHKMWFPDSS